MPTYTHASSTQLKAQSSALAVDHIPNRSLCVEHGPTVEKEATGDAAKRELLFASLRVCFLSRGGVQTVG